MQEKIQNLKQDALLELKNSQNEDEIKSIEIKYLGRQGLFNEIMKSLKDLSIEKKKTIGKLANENKKELEEAIISNYKRVENLKLASLAEDEWIDISVKRKGLKLGHRHLMSKFIDELEDIFSKMGFTTEEGPEIEKELYNFDQLNIPQTHPARDMHDTFWVENLEKHVLRTHTSPVQIHYMENNEAPFRIITIGKTFRKDSDATHSPMFYQLEGLMVGEDISMANLKFVLSKVFQSIFNDDSIKIRFRVSYFPFVEPGMEVDCTCPICKGKGVLANNKACKLCKQCGWLEVAGAGMVHPKVLKNVNIDSNKFSGFAFGIGLDRIIMIRHSIPHLRLLYENDLRFSEQF